MKPKLDTVFLIACKIFSEFLGFTDFTRLCPDIYIFHQNCLELSEAFKFGREGKAFFTGGHYLLLLIYLLPLLHLFLLLWGPLLFVCQSFYFSSFIEI